MHISCDLVTLLCSRARLKHSCNEDNRHSYLFNEVLRFDGSHEANKNFAFYRAEADEATPVAQCRGKLVPTRWEKLISCRELS